MVDDRSDDGRFTPEHTDDEILAAVRAHQPAATSEVADEVGVTRQGADHRLRQLRDDGRVSSKKIGASLVWFPADETPSPRELQEARSRRSRIAAGHSASSGDGRDDAASTAADDAPESLEDVEFPEGRERADCEATVRAARDYLRTDGPATMREIVAAVMPEHPLGYDADAALEKIEAGDRFRGAWWRRVVKPGLEALEDVESPPRGGSDWTYSGEA